MKIFLDSADFGDVRQALSRGVAGVTTNPTILSKQPKGDVFGFLVSLVRVIRESGNIVTAPAYMGGPMVEHGPSLSVEVWATSPQDMVDQAKHIHKVLAYQALAIKVPIGWQELNVMQQLRGLGIPVNCTCIFTEVQAIQALEAGAKFVSVFWNRLKEVGGDPGRVISNLRELMERDYPDREIIAGSIGRSPSDVLDAAKAGAHIVTTSLSVIKALSGHPQTEKSVQQFNADFAAWLEKPEPEMATP